MKIIIIIPARYDSTRLDGKLLLPLAEKPVIQHVYDNLKAVEGIAEVIIATDSDKIASWAHAQNASVIMTSDQHISGTDRIAEACAKIDCDYIINVQGDEPLIAGEHIIPLIKAFSTYPQADIFTLFELNTEKEMYNNPNEVKLVCDENQNAFYFSRAPIPYFRNEAQEFVFRKHIGVYAFKRSVLLELGDLKPGKLELAEKLEQLRWLENGYRIKALEVPSGLHSIDTEEDYSKVKSILE